MDPSNHSENNLSNATDTEIMMYKKNALHVTTFRIVSEPGDVDTPARKSNSFEPEMAHQIFGDSEIIFGHKHVSIRLYYLHNSFKCYLDLQTSGKIAEASGQKPDDVLAKLSPWLPSDHTSKKKQFFEEIRKEKHDHMFGESIDTFQGNKNEDFIVTVCDTKSEEFKQFHQRFETLLVWFIDGATAIDLDDDRWTIFYVYREIKDEESEEVVRSPVALCTVYKFYSYPDALRPRISQFFVLPTYQRKGIATNFYSIVYNYLKAIPNSKDITVEEPTPVFQQIRDYCDSLAVYNELTAANIALGNSRQLKQYIKNHKLFAKQGERVSDILHCISAQRSGYNVYVEFTETIKARITSNIEKETRGSKRLCNANRQGVGTDPKNTKSLIDVEYARYIESLEWPVNRLKNVAVLN